jgi:menaquinone-dependent protoporphyrinogen oxidase
MSQSILVGYASEHGSTKEIAQRVAVRLRERGSRVDVRATSDIQDGDTYDVAVLGSAIHNGAWLDEAVQYIQCNAASLAVRPVWLFSVACQMRCQDRCELSQRRCH